MWLRLAGWHVQHWESRGLRLVRAANTSALNCARAVQYRNKNKVPAFTVIYTSPHSLGPGKIQSSEFLFEPTQPSVGVSVSVPVRFSNQYVFWHERHMCSRLAQT